MYYRFSNVNPSIFFFKNAYICICNTLFTHFENIFQSAFFTHFVFFLMRCHTISHNVRTQAQVECYRASELWCSSRNQSRIVRVDVIWAETQDLTSCELGSYSIKTYPYRGHNYDPPMYSWCVFEYTFYSKLECVTS